MGIESLAAKGMSAEDIADAMGEELADVQRIMRRRGWNLALPQKIPLLLHPCHLKEAKDIEISLLVKSKTVASGSLEFKKVLQAFRGRYSEVTNLESDHGNGKVELDIEFRCFDLGPQVESDEVKQDVL